MDEWMERQMDVRMDNGSDGRTNIWMNEWLDAHGWIDVRMDE